MGPHLLCLRVLLLESDGLWVAQCLEFDIAAQGSTLDEAQQSFVRTFVAQCLVNSKAGKQPFEGARPAPGWYAEKFEAARPQELARKLTLVPSEVVADVRIAA